MIGWNEQEPESELSIKNLKLLIAYFKACCNLFGMGSFNISNFSRSFNLVHHQDLREENLFFDGVPSKR